MSHLQSDLARGSEYFQINTWWLPQFLKVKPTSITTTVSPERAWSQLLALCPPLVCICVHSLVLLCKEVSKKRKISPRQPVPPQSKGTKDGWDETRTESDFFIRSGGCFLPLICNSKETEIQKVTPFQFKRELSWHVYLRSIVYISRRWGALWQLGEMVTLAVEEWVWCKFTSPFRDGAGIWRLLARAAAAAAYKLWAYKADICFWIKLSILEADINPLCCFKFIFSLEKSNLVFQCRFELFFYLWVS